MVLSLPLDLAWYNACSATSMISFSVQVMSYLKKKQMIDIIGSTFDLIINKQVNMTRQVFCAKLNQQAEGLNALPFPGPTGEKIYQHISKEAWKMWLAHQTMLINEYRLNVIDPKARDFLQEEMQKFLFGEGSEKPKGFVPLSKK